MRRPILFAGVASILVLLLFSRSARRSDDSFVLTNPVEPEGASQPKRRVSCVFFQRGRRARWVPCPPPLTPPLSATVLSTPSCPGPHVSQVIEGLDTLWQLPPGANRSGVLFFAHGCSHSATDFWPSRLQGGWECPECLGLPEELIIRRIALARGYAFVAISSLDRDDRCWGTTMNVKASQDGQHVPKVLATVVKEEGLEGLPLYAAGASSGGAFALMLPHLMKLQVCVWGGPPAGSCLGWSVACLPACLSLFALAHVHLPGGGIGVVVGCPEESSCSLLLLLLLSGSGSACC